MKTINIKAVFSILLLMFSSAVFAQWEVAELNVQFSLPEIALLDIEPSTNNSIDFVITPAAESGSLPEVVETSNQALWLNYSSSMVNSVNSRFVVAEISSGNVTRGISLFLEASEFSGVGGGQLGQSSGKIELSNQPKTIIANLGNCYTGDGVNNGHLLSYSIELKDYTNLVSNGKTAFTILYTISDH